MSHHILADRIRELSEDVKISQEDLKESHSVIKKLACKFKMVNEKLLSKDRELKSLGELCKKLQGENVCLIYGRADWRLTETSSSK